MAEPFRITDIDWDAPDGTNLPSEVIVHLPGWLVLCEGEPSDEEWEEVINERLLDQHGYTAKNFGYEPEDS
jgi:hypothetical protein